MDPVHDAKLLLINARNSNAYLKEDHIQITRHVLSPEATPFVCMLQMAMCFYLDESCMN